MKNLVILTVLFFGLSAHAELKVGDTARYIISAQGQSLELVDLVTAINTNTGKYTDQQTVYKDGAKVQQEDQKEDIEENAQNEAMYDNCAKLPKELNPRTETIVIAAGKHSACHLTQKSGTTVINAWYGKVPFGVLKMVKTGTTDGSDLSIELKEFKKI